jgi:hypothetical protein
MVFVERVLLYDKLFTSHIMGNVVFVVVCFVDLVVFFNINCKKESQTLVLWCSVEVLIMRVILGWNVQIMFYS